MAKRLLYKIAYDQTFQGDDGRQETESYEETVVFRGDAAGAIAKLAKIGKGQVLGPGKWKCIGVIVKSVQPICVVDHP